MFSPRGVYWSRFLYPGKTDGTLSFAVTSSRIFGPSILLKQRIYIKILKNLSGDSDFFGNEDFLLNILNNLLQYFLDINIVRNTLI